MKMSQIFISYSRKDQEAAEIIVAALTNYNFTPWIDRNDIPKGEQFEREIYHGISKSIALLFLLSPDSIESEWCKKEIDFAVKNGKRIIPIVVKDVSREHIYPEVAHRNWIMCRPGQDSINQSTEEIRIALQTNYEWLKYHTNTQNKALDWEQKKDPSRLLRGKELKEAEEGFALLENADPKPTTLQRRFLLESRQDEEKRKTRWIVGLSVGGGILILLCIIATIAAFVAFNQTNVAGVQSSKALSRQVAGYSRSVSQADLDLVLLLSAQAYNFSDTSEAKSSLIYSLLIDPYLEGIMGGYGDMINLNESEINNILESDLRFGHRGWTSVDQIYLENQFPFVPLRPNTERLWGVYQYPQISSDGRSFSYTVCRSDIAGGTSSCDTTIAVWSAENNLVSADSWVDDMCNTASSSNTEEYKFEYLGDGKFALSDSDSNIIQEFLSSEVRIASQQYDTGKVIGFDVDDSKSKVVVSITYARHNSRLIVLLWDIVTGEELATLYRGDGWEYQMIEGEVKFSPSSDKVFICEEKLVSGGYPRENKSIIIDPGQLQSMACHIAGRNLTTDEWNQYVGNDVAYEKTCPEFPEGGYPIWSGAK